MAYCVPIDNSMVGDPAINCLADSLSVDFSTSKSFGGRVFVKGFSQDSNCNLVGDGKSKFDFSIGFDNCGLRRTREINGVSISATVVVSFHPIFITKVDRAYRVNCFYLETKKTLYQQLDVSELTTQTVSKQTSMPVCRYEILSDGPTGKPVRYARIGDHVYHQWTCESENPGVYCMKVHSCSVSDGQGGNPVLVLDQEGCEIDRFVLQNLDYSGDLSAGQGAHVFKFADKPSLHFNCQIELSLKDPKTGCRYLQPQCPGGNELSSEASNSYAGQVDEKSESNQAYFSSTPSNIPGYGDSETSQAPYTPRDPYGSKVEESTVAPYESNEPSDYSGGEQNNEYSQRILPGASFRVFPEATTGGYGEFQSGYTTKNINGYAQTQVVPSSRYSENQYEESTSTPVAIGYDSPNSGNTGVPAYNDFYQDETELSKLKKATGKVAIKRHVVEKRKVADFDLPEKSLVVVEIDEDPPCEFPST
ncbi:hypothetical protein FO519_008111 [Halicephalobus sp. NKZ332]|nr:hypothetical protein FO519_008111 [Halicephalobus sp. NKZ332]